MFGERLKQLRLSTNKTQQQIANQLGISRAAYSHLENGRNEPDSTTLVKLANIFDVTTDYLLGKNKTPVWAKEEDTIQLDRILKSKAGMFYGEDEATEKDREIIDDLVAGYFWSKKQKEKLNNKEG